MELSTFSTTVSRACDRLAKLALGPTARAVKRENLTYLSVEKLGEIGRQLRQLNSRHVPGDFLEFGVALGGSGIVIAERGVCSDPPRKFHGFDVFEMIPPPTSDKDDEKSKARYRKIVSGESNGLGGETYYGYRADLIGDVRASFARHAVPVDGKSIFLHKGLFETTWPQAAPQINSVAFAHIDCDWYDPVRYCLHAVAEKLSAGGVIVLDDYNDYGGARTATDEFLAANPAFAPVRNSGNLVVRKSG